MKTVFVIRWPQTTIPTFKIAACECLQKVRIGEQICLVRMKLSRPLSAREAVVHLFAFEYFQDGLIVVVANSISDSDSVDRSIPNVQDVVQVDLVGGFALQKVTDNRNYFRTIGNLDIKLDFIPPSLINFISRQLIGGGFKLYKMVNANLEMRQRNSSRLKTSIVGTPGKIWQGPSWIDSSLMWKPCPTAITWRYLNAPASNLLRLSQEVASVVKGDEDFRKVLKDPMYARIREALYSNDKIPNSYITLELQVPLGEEIRRNNDEKCPEPKVHRDNCAFNIPGQGDFEVRDKNIHSEIEEIEDENCEKIERLDEDDRKVCDSPVNQLVQKPTKNKNVGISLEVKQALGTLDKAISIIREYRCNLDIRTVPHTNITSVEAETDSLQDSKSSEADKDHRNVGDFGEVSHEHRSSSCCRRTSSSLCTREAHHNKIAPASPDAYATILDEAHTDEATIGTIMEGISKDDYVTVAMASMRRSSVKEKLENYRDIAACIFSLGKQWLKSAQLYLKETNTIFYPI
ncbi:hypothetical protein K7X08_007399 [Anisodus acutangulus]|uniref:Uncharacterized protein n=1 Tax=Anisodus acutangulus TaxID=402998 RepID=A0A9Q1LCL4_9SOLA|nr:hypothetical protein K7X08_007399 [Anisodus acutangulus]